MGSGSSGLMQSSPERLSKNEDVGKGGSEYEERD